MQASFTRNTPKTPLKGLKLALMRLIIAIVILLPLFHTPASATLLENSTVIYAYHRIDEPEYPSTNINFEQFESHIRKILQDGYNVVSINQVYDAFKNGTKLPEKSVAITFEGGHRSILEDAIPLLLKHDLPFTIFFSVDQADWQSDSYLSWKDLNKLKRKGDVTLGLHPATYRHLLETNEEELKKQINRAKSRYREEFEEEALYFSYPFGEYSKAIQKLVKDNHFIAAFGQQSGVASETSDLFGIPRFAMTESYGGIERFQLTANALPLRVKDISPDDPLLKNNPPAIGFTLLEKHDNLNQLSCFATATGKTSLEIIGQRVEIRLNEPFTQGRGRINCTLPAGFDHEGVMRWRWFGMLFSIDDQLIYEPNID